MSLDERLLSGPGFAVFSRSPIFSAGVVERYLTLDRAVKHVVAIVQPETELSLVEGISRALAARGVELLLVPWASYGAPANVARVAALPSESLAFVSADHHRSTTDRLDPRRAHVRRKAARKKIAIDTIPYEAAPWRLFFPFAFFDRTILGYPHSYAFEQDYDSFLDGKLADNPCAAERLAAATWRAAVVDEPLLFDRRPAVTELPLLRVDHAAYATERDRLFASEKSVSGVKRKLSAWIQARCPARSIPLDMKRVYAPGLDQIVHTDLPFDRWLAAEILGLMNHTDALLARYVEFQHAAGER